MNIAFISYEYPTETGGGGIGTYLTQIVAHLPNLGHKMVVFCGTKEPHAWWQNEWVRRIPCNDANHFNSEVVAHFEVLHNEIAFDIIEGTDFMAWGYSVHKAFPHIPYVVRAHSNGYIVNKYLFEPLKGWDKLRFILGALRRGKLPKLPSKPLPKAFEYEAICLHEADAVLSPSHSLGKIYQELDWCSTYTFLPYIFSPLKDLLTIKSQVKDEIKIVYYGRLEIRKGVLELTKAIPIIVNRHKNISFHFYGKSALSPKANVDMQTYLYHKLSNYQDKCIFHGAFEPKLLPKIIENASIVILPSRFDNSPLACYESMAAGKPVIGSVFGGMAEIIEHGESGFVINPFDTQAMVMYLDKLITNPKLRLQLGENGRKRIIENYSADNILKQQIEIYTKLINSRNGVKFR